MKKYLALLACCANLALAQSHDNTALAISREIRERHLPFGTVLNPMYNSADSTTIQTYTRCGDSAIWTGHWLAAEAFRFAVTGAVDALDAAGTALRGVESLVGVTGSARVLARCVVDPSSPFAAGPRDEEAHHREYVGAYQGRRLIWFGNTSRDQYMGVFFGLSVAYEHVPQLRQRVSAVATTLIEELLDDDWAVDMPDRLFPSTVFWHRPDQQLAILQVGRQINPARFSAPYNERRRILFGLDTLIGLEASEPHESYFKFNLNAVTLYSLLRLEERDSSRQDDYRKAYETFRSGVKGHGNAFFNAIDRALVGPNSGRDKETERLLDEWLTRPRRDTWVDLRPKYRACGNDRACDPIPVAERVRTDFLWQRSPFQLYGGGEGRIEAAGIDFVLPYWMERYHARTASRAVSSATGRPLLAPGSLASLYGVELSGALLLTDAAGVEHTLWPLFSGSGQVNFAVPERAAIGRGRITAGTSGFETEIVTVAPGLFSADASGIGVAAAIAAQEGIAPSPAFRCDFGRCAAVALRPSPGRPVYVSLYGTGLRRGSGMLRVSVGGVDVPVLYAGPQNEFAGLDQINFRLDATTTKKGELDVVVRVADSVSNTVRLLVD